MRTLGIYTPLEYISYHSTHGTSLAHSRVTRSSSQWTLGVVPYNLTVSTSAAPRPMLLVLRPVDLRPVDLRPAADAARAPPPPPPPCRRRRRSRAPRRGTLYM